MESFMAGVVNLWDKVPGPVAAGIIIAVGWVAAKLARFLVSGFFTLARFDRMSDKTGLTEFLRKGNVRYAPSKLMGALVYWVIIMFGFIRSSRELDIALFTSLSGHLSELVPSMLAAGLILVIGAIIIAFLANFSLTIARNAGLPNANLLFKSIKYAGNILVAAIALEQVGLGQTIISSMFLLLFGATVFGAALAFGLGCKDMAKDAMSRFIQTLKERERESKGTDLEG